MSLETDLYTLLSNNAGVIALISTRIYPIIAPQDATLPFATYSRVSTNNIFNLDNQSDLENASYQIDCYAETYLGSVAIADAIKTAMKAASTFSTADMDESHDIEEDLFRVILQFSVWQ